MSLPILDSISGHLNGYDPSNTSQHTVTGNNCYLISMGGGGPLSTPTDDPVASVTYNGVAMTRLLVSTGAGASRAFIYGLKIPVGDGVAHDIVWTFKSGTVGMDVKSVSFSNVDQTTPIAASASFQDSAASTRTTTIAAPANSMAVDYFVTNSPSTPNVPGSGQTEIGVQTNLIQHRGAASYKPNATSMTWGFGSTSQSVAHAVVAVAGITVADTTVPTMTGSLTSSGVSSTGFTIDWSGTTRSDNVAITGYETSTDNSTWTDAGNVTSKAFTGLSASTGYTRYVRAYDAAGNKSTPSLSITVTTSAPSGDTTAPVLSGSITQGTITATSSQITWPAATDNVAVDHYEVSKDSGSTWTNVAVGTLTYTFTGLSASTVYGQRVRALDAAGNVSAVLSLSVTTSAASSSVTLTSPAQGGKYAANGAYRASVACNASILNKTTHAVIERKTGLTSPASGPFILTTTLVTSGTEVLVLVKADADDHDLGAFFATAV